MLHSQTLKLRQFGSNLLTLMQEESVWIPIGRMLAMLAGVVAVRALTELVSPDQYGRLSLVTGLISLVSLVLYTSLGKSVNRYIWDYVNQESGYTWVSSVALAIVASGLIFTLVIWGAVALNVELGIAPQVAVWTIPTLLIAGGLSTTLLGMLNILHEHRIFVIGTVTYAWLKPGLAIITVFMLLPTAESIMKGYATSSVVVLLGVVWIVWQRGLLRHSLKLSNLIRPLRQMSLYAAPFMLVHIFYWIQTTANRYVLDYNVGVAQVGIFVVAVAVARIPIQSVESIFGQIHQPILYKKIGKRSDDEAADVLTRRESFSDYIHSFLIITLPVLGFTVIGANLLIRFLAGRQYWPGAGLMPWVTLAEFLRALTAVASIAFEVERRPSKLIFPIAIASLMTLVMTYLLSGSLGILGAGIALVLGTSVWLILTWIPASQLACWHISWLKILRTAFMSCLIAGTAWLAGRLALNWGFLAQSIVFVMAFGLAYLVYAGRTVFGLTGVTR